MLKHSMRRAALRDGADTLPERCGVAPSAAQGHRCVLAAMCLGSMLTMFNATSVNVMLPSIARSFEASASELQWVSAIYTLCYAGMMLPGGALGDRLGRRASFLLGVAVFVVGSAGCAFSPSYLVLLSARVVQAVGAATLLPQTLSILTHEYGDLSVRVRAVATWSGISSLGLAMGPVLGGVIVSISSWRWGFAFSAILGVLALLLGWAVVPASRHGRPVQAPSGTDLAGIVLSVVALSALALGLIESATFGWGSPVIISSFFVSAAATAGFLMVERSLGRRNGYRIMPLSIWRSRQLIASNISAIAYFFMFFGILYFFSIDLQDHRGFSVVATGIVFLPMTFTMVVVGPLAGRLGVRFGTGAILAVGMGVGAAGCWLLAVVPAQAALANIAWRLLLVGIGSGLMSSSMSNLAVTGIARIYSGSASAVHNMFRQIGSTLGVAVMGTIVGASASFAAGLEHAMLAAASLLALGGIVVLLLTRTRTPQAHGSERAGASATDSRTRQAVSYTHPKRTAQFDLDPKGKV